MDRHTSHGRSLEYIATENPIEIGGGNDLGVEILNRTIELPDSRKIILLDSRTNNHPEIPAISGPYLDVFLNGEKEGVEMARFSIPERPIGNKKIRCTFPYSHYKNEEIIEGFFKEDKFFVSFAPDLLYEIIRLPSKRWLQKIPIEKIYTYEKDINSLARKPAQLILLFDTIGLRKPIENAVKEDIIKSKTTYARIKEIKRLYEETDKFQLLSLTPQKFFNIVGEMELPSYYKKVDRLDKKGKSYRIFIN